MTFVASLTGRQGRNGDGSEETFVTHALTSEGHDASEDGTGRGTPLVAAPLSHGSNPNSNAAGRRREDASVASLSGLGSGGPDANGGRGGETKYDLDNDTYIVNAMSAKWKKYSGGPAEDEVQNLVVQGGSQQDQFVYPGGVTPTLAHASNTHMGHYQPKAVLGTGVRRLTPRECERLQALPDDWTAHGPDSRRYAALGDAVTASVGEWIGRRIMQAERKLEDSSATRERSV